MFNSISMEVQAFYLARLIYRDTELEDYHRESAVLGPELFEEMLAVVRKNVERVRRFHGKMLSIRTESDADEALRAMPDTERDEFKRYVYAFNFLSKSRCNWDSPRMLEHRSRLRRTWRFTYYPEGLQSAAGRGER